MLKLMGVFLQGCVGHVTPVAVGPQHRPNSRAYRHTCPVPSNFDIQVLVASSTQGQIQTLKSACGLWPSYHVPGKGNVDRNIYLVHVSYLTHSRAAELRWLCMRTLDLLPLLAAGSE